MTKPLIEIHSLNETDVDFTLHYSDVKEANRLRRILMSQITTMSIDIVQIDINESNLPDEVLCHRFAFIPLKSNDDFHCDKDECETCTTIFEIDIDGSKSEIFSHDLKYISGHNLFPIEDILICPLAKNQKIRLTAIAKKGIGAQHAKWNPIIGMTFDSTDTGSYNFKFQTSGVIDPKNLLNEALQKGNFDFRVKK